MEGTWGFVPFECDIQGELTQSCLVANESLVEGTEPTVAPELQMAPV